MREKNTGVERKRSGSTFMPVGIPRPVCGHLIISIPMRTFLDFSVIAVKVGTGRLDRLFFRCVTWGVTHLLLMSEH